MSWTRYDLFLFQFFGFSVRSRSRWRHYARLGWSLLVLIGAVAYILHVLPRTITFVAALTSQVNVMSDQSVLLTSCSSQIISLAESLVKHRRTQRLLFGFHRIAWQVCTEQQVTAARKRACLANWLQLLVLCTLITIGITKTGRESWSYHRWFMWAHVTVCVRLMEIALHVEMLVVLIAGLRTVLARVGPDWPQDTQKRTLERIEYANDVYGQICAHALAIGDSFGWSLLAIAVYTLNGMVNNSFWLSHWITGMDPSA